MDNRKVTQKDVKFGRRLQKVRNQAGLTQEQLATKTGLSDTFIGLLETGKRRPSFKSLQRIASALGVKAKDILPF